MVVKLAASMPVSRSAMRHSTELPAKASMVRVVSRRVRAVGIWRIQINSQSL
jgi:hypothetical protein